MSDVIVDRRISGHDRPSANRAKFIKHHEDVIKQAIRKSISNSNIKDLADNKGNIKIVTKKEQYPYLDIQRKQIDQVYIGNKKYRKGNTIPRPPSGDGEPRQASDDGGKFDPIEFELTEEEFRKYLFEDLEVPHLDKTTAKDLFKKEYYHAGFVTDGNPANLSIIRSYKNGLARNIAMRAAIEEEIAELQLQRSLFVQPCDELTAVYNKLLELQQQLETIPFLDDMDLRYKFKEAKPVPTTKAVMFCIMDYSGSMSDKLKDLAKRFYFLLYLFLRSKYDQFDIVFIRHTDTAEEVTGDEFFHSTGVGGTKISSALELTTKIIDDRYPPSEYNIYCAQATDNENFDSDDIRCENILNQVLVPLSQYFIHIFVNRNEYIRSDIFYGHLINHLQKQHKNLESIMLVNNGDVWKEFSRIFKPKDKKV